MQQAPTAQRPPDPEAIPPATRTASGADDTAGVFSGIIVALLVHALVVGTAVRLGRPEGNVARTARPQNLAENTVIETHLLKRGGGIFDPRRVVHRQAPVLAEREAPRTVAPVRDPTAVQLPQDAGAQDYMAAITGRTRRGQGNQDLAERLARLATQEQQNNSDPTATGPGDPSGSEVGDTTDPALATRGAATKVDEFLRRRVRVTSALTGSEPRRLTFRIRLSPTGQIENASIVTRSGNEALDADILVQVQQLETSHAQIDTLTPEELTQVAGRNINVNVPLNSLAH